MKNVDRKLLKRFLPVGAQKEIAKELGFRPETVSRYFNYKTDNAIIELCVLKRALKLQKEHESLLKEMEAYA